MDILLVYYKSYVYNFQRLFYLNNVQHKKIVYSAHSYLNILDFIIDKNTYLMEYIFLK